MTFDSLISVTKSENLRFKINFWYIGTTKNRECAVFSSVSSKIKKENRPPLNVGMENFRHVNLKY